MRPFLSMSCSRKMQKLLLDPKLFKFDRDPSIVLRGLRAITLTTYRATSVISPQAFTKCGLVHVSKEVHEGHLFPLF